MQTETQQTIFTAPGCAIIPKPLDQAKEILGGYVDSQEFWVILTDGAGFKAIEPLIVLCEKLVAKRPRR